MYTISRGHFLSANSEPKSDELTFMKVLALIDPSWGKLQARIQDAKELGFSFVQLIVGMTK